MFNKISNCVWHNHCLHIKREASAINVAKSSTTLPFNVAHPSCMRLAERDFSFDSFAFNDKDDAPPSHPLTFKAIAAEQRKWKKLQTKLKKEDSPHKLEKMFKALVTLARDRLQRQQDSRAPKAATSSCRMVSSPSLSSWREAPRTDPSSSTDKGQAFLAYSSLALQSSR